MAKECQTSFPWVVGMRLPPTKEANWKKLHQAHLKVVQAQDRLLLETQTAQAYIFSA